MAACGPFQMLSAELRAYVSSSSPSATLVTRESKKSALSSASGKKSLCSVLRPAGRSCASFPALLDLSVSRATRVKAHLGEKACGEADEPEVLSRSKA